MPCRQLWQSVWAAVCTQLVACSGRFALGLRAASKRSFLSFYNYILYIEYTPTRGPTQVTMDTLWKYLPLVTNKLRDLWREFNERYCFQVLSDVRRWLVS